MRDFRVGDKIRRKNDDWGGVHVGCLYTIKSIFIDNNRTTWFELHEVFKEDSIDGHPFSAKNFDLVTAVNPFESKSENEFKKYISHKA